MEVITKRTLIASVAERWAGQHCTRGEWRETQMGLSQVIYERLKALPPDATEDDVANAIGNRSWTNNRCDNCRQDSPVLVRLGPEPDYDTPTVYACEKCLQAALNAVEQSREPSP